jgi:thioredoxin-like negative regulator of GroEL
VKRASDIDARIWRAVQRIERRGERPTNGAVRAELIELYGAGGSFREISPVVEQWRRDVVAKAERRIEAAVAAIGKLEHEVEVEEVCRRFRQQHDRDIRVTVTMDRKGKRTRPPAG